MSVTFGGQVLRFSVLSRGVFLIHDSPESWLFVSFLWPIFIKQGL